MIDIILSLQFLIQILIKKKVFAQSFDLVIRLKNTPTSRVKKQAT